VGENQGAFSKEMLRQYAVDINLDAEVFNACLDSSKYTELVRKETAAAQQLGVSSTPTFVINGQGLAGAQPFEVFQQIIEAELAP
jgi:predicted DsbA family dithiol-disulfide isomerase